MIPTVLIRSSSSIDDYGLIRTAENELKKRMRELGFRTITSSADAFPESSSSENVYAVIDLRLLTGSGFSEGYTIACQRKGDRRQTTISSETYRGILYGAFHFAQLLGKKGILLEDMRISRRPLYPIREWATHAFQGNFNLPLGGSFDRPIEEIEEALLRIIREAPRYGINRLKLCGRVAEGMDISWLIPYRFLPGPFSVLERGEGPRKARRESIRRIADFAHAHGLDLLVWDHELVYPSCLPDFYPEIKGEEYPICFSQSFWDDFLRGKLEELFLLVPELDGITLTFAETRGYNLLDHAGCQCERCTDVTADSKLLRVMGIFAEVCREFGKTLEVRSYNESPAAAEAIKRALLAAPEDVTIVTKYTYVDFRGVHYPDNPMIGCFSQPEVVEFTLAPEGNGYGYLPALLGDFYGKRIRFAEDRGVKGFVGRLDYHLQFSHAHFFHSGSSILTFDTENEFNIFLFSELLWHPRKSIEALWQTWAEGRYGTEAADTVVPALKRTADITQGIYYVDGIHGPSQLDQVTMPDTMRKVFEDNFLVRFDPGDAGISVRTARLIHPDENTVSAMVKEKKQAEKLARLSLRNIESVRKHIPVEEYKNLYRRVSLAVESCILWRWVTESFLRLEMWEAVREKKRSKGGFCSEERALQKAVAELLAQALEMERIFGRSYPVYNAARGIDVYSFILAVVRKASGCRRDLLFGVEDLWNGLVDMGKAGPSRCFRTIMLKLPQGVEVYVSREKAKMLQATVTDVCESGEEHCLVYPLPFTIEDGLSFSGPSTRCLHMSRSRGTVQIETVN